MSFEHRLTARFYEIDRAGIVFFGRFFEYCHATFEEMVLAAFGEWDSHIANKTWGMPLVHAEADFQKPTRMGDRLTVHLDVGRLGKRSVTFAYRVVGEDGEPRATAKLVHAFIDMKSFEPLDVPQEFIEGIRKIGLSPLQGGD